MMMRRWKSSTTRNVSHDDSCWPIDGLVFVSAGVVCCVDLVLLDYYYYFVVTKHCDWCWTNAFDREEDVEEEIGDVVWVDEDDLQEEANHSGHSSESDLVFESADRPQYLRRSRVSDETSVSCWRKIFPVNHDAVVVVVAADRRGGREDGDGWCVVRYLLLVCSDPPVPSWNLAGTLSLSVTHP
jgi:hypothetical protein